MIRTWCNHFLEEDGTHSDIHEQSLKYYMTSSLIVQSLRWKNSVYKDYSWAETTINTNVNMNPFLQIVIWSFIVQKVIRSFFA